MCIYTRTQAPRQTYKSYIFCVCACYIKRKYEKHIQRLYLFIYDNVPMYNVLFFLKSSTGRHWIATYYPKITFKLKDQTKKKLENSHCSLILNRILLQNDVNIISVQLFIFQEGQFVTETLHSNISPGISFNKKPKS